MKLIITGDSHTKAISDALTTEASPPGVEVVGKPLCSGIAFRKAFHEVTPSGVTFTDPIYRERLRILSGSETFSASSDITYGLVLGFHTAAIYRDKTWRTHAPANIAGKLGLQSVSSQVIETIGADRQKHVLAFLADLKRAKVRFFVVSAPPPRRSHPAIAKGIAPQTLIQVNDLARKGISAKMLDEDFQVVAPPTEVVDADGFLLSQYEQIQQDDHHHANVQYGGVMLKKIFAQTASL